MAVAMLIDNPNGSQKIYERLRARMGLDGPPAASSTSPGGARTAAGG